LQDWIRNDVVARDPAPSFYAYTQEYTVPGSDERRTRRGFIGAGKLEDYSAGVVFRHEQTLSGRKRIAWNFFAIRGRIRGNFLCCTPCGAPHRRDSLRSSIELDAGDGAAR